MRSTTAISSCEQACLRHRWELPDRYKIAADLCASSDIAGRVWAVNRSQEM